jgi:hypothetical protein
VPTAYSEAGRTVRTACFFDAHHLGFRLDAKWRLGITANSRQEKLQHNVCVLWWLDVGPNVNPANAYVSAEALAPNAISGCIIPSKQKRHA